MPSSLCGENRRGHVGTSAGIADGGDAGRSPKPALRGFDSSRSRLRSFGATAGRSALGPPGRIALRIRAGSAHGQAERKYPGLEDDVTSGSPGSTPARPQGRGTLSVDCPDRCHGVADLHACLSRRRYGVGTRWHRFVNRAAGRRGTVREPREKSTRGGLQAPGLPRAAPSSNPAGCLALNQETEVRILPGQPRPARGIPDRARRCRPIPEAFEGCPPRILRS